MRLHVSEKDSLFLLQNKAAAQSAISMKLFLVNGDAFIRQPLYGPDLAAAEYFFTFFK